jgi:hypothetical protein
MRRITPLRLVAALILATASFVSADAQQRQPSKTTASGTKDNARISSKLCGPQAVHYHDHQGCMAYQARLGWDAGTASRFCGARCRG